MATITEDYVSFETAKLLKEKGFNEKCWGLYESLFDDDDNPKVSWGRWIESAHTNFFEDEFFICSAPTLQMAMKWLREVHKLFIEIKMSKNTFLWGHRVSISNGITSYLHANTFNKYEEACEAAIKYCLENLI